MDQILVYTQKARSGNAERISGVVDCCFYHAYRLSLCCDTVTGTNRPTTLLQSQAALAV
jgi:hypothetical protein